jgi:hypothetical protein
MAFAEAMVVLMPRAVLIVLSLGVCAMRVHAPSVDVSGAVREVNSCLRIVRLAASRRSRFSTVDSLPAYGGAVGDLDR